MNQCPRCHSPGKLVARSRSGKLYYYFRHSARLASGKSSAKYCYLGPGIYQHASGIHAIQGIRLELKGMLDAGKIYSYLDSLVDYLETHPGIRDRAKLAQLTSRLAKLAESSPIRGHGS